MRARTQDDLVKQDQGFKPQEETFEVGLPGVKSLHTKSIEEIAEAVAVVLKSQRSISRLDWRVGEGIFVTVPTQ